MKFFFRGLLSFYLSLTLAASLVAVPSGTVVEDEGGLTLTTVTRDVAQPPVPFRCNTRRTFAAVKPSNMVALLVGNEAYAPGSDFSPLNYCRDDVTLLGRLLNECCKVKEEKIHRAWDISAGQFTTMLKAIVKGLESHQSLLISFSGHGARDGSLVFTDGSRIGPGELKALVNSFKNDTVLLLDACYSGNNEGPLEQREETVYRDNCLRIYASLAHNTAKEIQYQNEYFYYIKDFQEEVLGLKEESALEGNGYFTSFLGYFFAEYDFSAAKNVTFQDLTTYISNKGKQYAEFLAIKGVRAVNFRQEALLRVSQQPKFYPLDKKVNFRELNNQFLVLFSPVKSPLRVTNKFSAGVMYGQLPGFPGMESVTPSFTWQLLMAPAVLPGISLGLETGYACLKRLETQSNQGVDLHMIPVLGVGSYSLPLSKAWQLRVAAGLGGVVSFWNFKEHIYAGGVMKIQPGFKFHGSVGLDFTLGKYLNFALDIRVIGICFSRTLFYLGGELPFSFAQNFSLGGI